MSIALEECPKCGEPVEWSGDVSDISESEVFVDAYCTADNNCDAGWQEIYTHVDTKVGD